MAIEADALDEATLEILKHPCLDIPKAWTGGDMSAFLKSEFAAFEALLAKLPGRLGAALKPGAYWRRDLEASLAAVPDLVQRKRDERAWTVFEDAVDEHAGRLRVMSPRHRVKILSSASWYRLSAWSGVRTRADMFHVPFGLAQHSYRFSPVGRPALYLGNNVYTCWLECRAPQLEQCRVSRFEHHLGDLEFLDIPVNHHTYLGPLEFEALGSRLGISTPALRLQNSPYCADVVAELADYLSLWPLLAACAIQKNGEAREPVEYLIPQYLTRWVEKRGLFGIRFFTTRFAPRRPAAGAQADPLDSSNNTSDLSVNVVIPTRTTGRTDGYCDFLVEHVYCTEPRTFADAAAIPDAELFTSSAADRREAARGRYWIEWSGSQCHYQETPFGRMEYLLDRLPAGRIQGPTP